MQQPAPESITSLATAQPASHLPVRSFAKSNNDLVDAFLRYLLVKNYAVCTQKNCEKCAREFVKLLGPRNLLDADQSLVRRFLFGGVRAKASSSVVWQALAGLKLFYRFLVKAGVAKFSPVEFVKGPKRTPRKLIRCLSEQEINRLLDAADDPVGKAVVALAYASGLRLAELANLRLEDIDLDREKLMVRGGKGDRDRLAFIGAEAVEAIQSLIGGDTHGFLFLNSCGRPLGRHGIYHIIRGAGARAGLDVHPHMLRHAFATHMMNRGADIRYIQELLGHKSISTTQLYTHCTIVNLVAAHAKFHPRGDGQ